ncbi:MAG: hypothetical protein JST16_13860 [Bdellovibrionales bacterium]|nr:hypothetical protein [Bdellovibrionales bacterium]
MESKNNKARGKGFSEPVGPDQTASITETDHEGDGLTNSPEGIEELQGSPLRQSTVTRSLLRVQDGLVRPELAEALHLGPFPSPRRSSEDPFAPVILGPFDLELLESLGRKGLLSGQDAILGGFGRWRTAKEVLPDFVDATSSDEGTDTMTATATVGSADEEDVEGTVTESVTLEIDAIDDHADREEETKTPVPEVHAESRPAAPMSQSLDLDLDEVPPPAVTKAEPSARANRTAVKAPNAKSSAPASVTSVRRVVDTESPRASAKRYSGFTMTLFGVVLGAGLFYLTTRRSPVVAPPPPAEDVRVAVPARPLSAVPTDCPENLRPRPVEALYSDDAGLVAKIRPILNAYENGSTSLSPTDEKLLREVADPASASFDARRLAGNQLAVFYLANSRSDEAQRVLKPLLEANASDPTTLLNAAFLRMGNGEYDEARENATAALRLMPPSTSWIAYSVVGLIEGYRGRMEQAQNHFRDALRRSPNNPFIYGLFIRTLAERPSEAEKIRGLMREALWSDPDRLLDSPIRAPLAGHLLVSLSVEGLVKGAEAAGSKLSPGKKAFVRWLEARYRRNPLSQPLARVTELLAQESDPQSQLLYAFTLREQNKMDEAGEALNKVIPLLQGQEDLKSSWPWSFAGDVQYARRNVSQGIVFYQNALSRNPQDIAAVLGMALAFRESSEFKLAEQRLAEALSLDPLFVPAQLRISRFEWHSGPRGQ